MVDVTSPKNRELKTLDSVAEEYYKNQKMKIAENYQKFMRRVYKFQNRDRYT